MNRFSSFSARLSPASDLLSHSIRSTTLGAAALLLALSGVAYSAPPADIEGELDVIIKEDFDHGRFETDYFIRDEQAADWYQLEFDRTPPGHLKSGQHLRVHGTPNGRKLRVESFDEQASAATDGTATVNDPAALAAGTAVDEHKAVVLIVNLTNATAGQSKTQIIGNLFTNAHSVDGLYREASLGQVGFPADTDSDGQPDVFGPFDIAYDNSTCDYYSWAYAAESAAQAAGVDLSLYKHRVFVIPNTASLPACSWSGIANVGCGTFCRAWIAGSTGMIFTHELGHNLNLAHAGTDPGNDGTIDSVYGDYSDPMGISSSSWYQFNAAHIDQLGWYAGIPGTIATVVGNGTYELAAIGADPTISGAPAALKIYRPNTGDYYYLSFRQPVGNYNQLSTTYTQGVNIHRYTGSGYGYTSLIKTLTDGATFTDAANGISVTQVARAGNYVTLQVSLTCAAATPTLSLSPATLTTRPGGAAGFGLGLTNQDAANCGASTFALAYTGAIPGTLSPVSQTLSGGQTGSATLSLSSATAVSGTYTVQVTVRDPSGLHANIQGTATLILDGIAPSVPTGLKASLNNQGKVVLSWAASTDTLSGISGYTVYRNGMALTQVSTTGYTDTSVAAGTSYRYSLSALDGAGNASGQSGAISITTGITKGKK